MQTLRRTVLPLAIACSVAYVVLAVHAFNQQLFQLDHEVDQLVRSREDVDESTRAFMRALSRVTSGYVLVPLALGAFVVLKHRGHRAAKLIPWTIVGGYALFVLTKWIVSRPRPKSASYGFPSAHAFGAVVLFGSLIYLLWTLEIGRFWRWTGTALLALLILGVAVSRIYLRAHWVSDVLGGLAGGVAYLLFFVLAAEPGLRPALWRR